MRTIERSSIDFGKDDFKPDPTLFPHIQPLTPWLDSTRSPREHSLAELTEAGCNSLKQALQLIYERTTPSDIEKRLRSHLAGILIAFAEKDSVEGPRVIHGQYVALYEMRFLQQATSIPGGAAEFQRKTGYIADDMGIDIVLDGEYGVEGAINRGRLFALQGFITLTEGLIERAFKVAALRSDSGKISSLVNAEVQGLGDCISQIEASPFAIIAHCGVGGARSLIEENFVVSGAAACEQTPEIIVLDSEWCEPPNRAQAIQSALEKSTSHLFQARCFRDDIEKGSFGYFTESRFIRWMLFGEAASQ